MLGRSRLVASSHALSLSSIRSDVVASPVSRLTLTTQQQYEVSCLPADRIEAGAFTLRVELRDDVNSWLGHLCSSVVVCGRVDGGAVLCRRLRGVPGSQDGRGVSSMAVRTAWSIGVVHPYGSGGAPGSRLS